jgi:hypothetical protein
MTDLLDLNITVLFMTDLLRVKYFNFIYDWFAPDYNDLCIWFVSNLCCYYKYINDWHE